MELAPAARSSQGAAAALDRHRIVTVFRHGCRCVVTLGVGVVSETGRRCRRCAAELAADAHPRRLFCGPACRQSAHRARHAPAGGGDLAALDAAVRRAAGDLAFAAAEIANLDDPSGREHHTRDVAAFPALLAALLAAAVAHDRAAGYTWEDIGDYLGISADTARGRWSRPGGPAAMLLPLQMT
jgi:hypothetical protein